MNRILRIACAGLLLLCNSASGARFESSYLAFEIPEGWTCQREDTEFVCEPVRAENTPTDAIMILTAKLAGPDDTLAAYRQWLEKNPPATGRGSILVAAHLVTINKTVWVDASCLGSELPNYVTRYLATTRNGVAILFTFSAHRTRYDALIGTALQVIYTLNVKNDWR